MFIRFFVSGVECWLFFGRCQDACEQLAHVAAFTISSYSTTSSRSGKPFNPLLGEFSYMICSSKASITIEIYSIIVQKGLIVNSSIIEALKLQLMLLNYNWFFYMIIEAFKLQLKPLNYN